MKRSVFVVLTVFLALSSQASWYWPFGSDGTRAKKVRVSELMEPASLLIDEAADLAAEGKHGEAIEKYRAALDELDRIEMENPDRVKKPEFATLRNKRAYVNAAIESLQLGQVRDNARAVAVSDTTELERKLAEEKAGRKKSPKDVVQTGGKGADGRKDADDRKTVARVSVAPKPKSKRDQAIADIVKGDYAAAEILIREMLAAKPKSAMALNLRAAMEMMQGRLREAEDTLDEAIQSNPKSHFAYYNQAWLALKKNPDAKDVARRYYETGRSLGGPKDDGLETAFK